jgi:hypothetical protein
MSDLGDKIRALSDTMYAMDYNRLDALAAEVDHLERYVVELDAAFDDAVKNPRDEYHTMAELYEYRMLYNAYLFNELYSHACLAPGEVVKSWRHHDGEECFGGGWFIVTAQLHTGQVSNHYKAEHWGLFDIPEVEVAPEWDGHTPEEAARRLRAAL